MKKVADFRMQGELLEGFRMEGLDAPEKSGEQFPQGISKRGKASAEKKRFLEKVIYEQAVEEAMIQGAMVSLEIDEEEQSGILIFEGPELMRVHHDTRLDELVETILAENSYYIINTKGNQLHMEFHFQLTEDSL